MMTSTISTLSRSTKCETVLIDTTKRLQVQSNLLCTAGMMCKLLNKVLLSSGRSSDKLALCNTG